MKTFDRKIADYSHPSLTTISISTLNFRLHVTIKVTSNTKSNIEFTAIDRTTGINDQVIQVVIAVTFDFIFQAFINERNEND
jgi:hypothetical protein